MLRVAAILVCVTGCDVVFGPSLHDGPTTADDARIQVDAAADANEQHNEDGDAYPDIIDPCPALAGDDADVDGDMVGDLCDPDPSSPDQQAIYFNGFGVDTAGLVVSAGIHVVGDQARFDGILNDTVAMHLEGGFDHVDIYTHVIVDAVDPAAPSSDIDLVSSHTTADPLRGISCRIGGLLVAPGITSVELWRHTMTGDTGLSIGSTSNQALVDADDDAHLEHDGPGQEVGCDFGGASPTANVSLLNPGGVGLVVRRADVRFDYLFVVVTNL